MVEKIERSTYDGEWFEDELKSDIYDVCKEVMTEEFVAKYKHRAVLDRDVLKYQYMAEIISNQIGDVVELYDQEYANSGDREVLGITLFDNAIKNMIASNIRENLIT